MLPCDLLKGLGSRKGEIDRKKDDALDVLDILEESNDSVPSHVHSLPFGFLL